MKLTDENYDIAGFELPRLTRLLLILRLSKTGAWELRASLLDIAKLWLQHRLGSKVDGLKFRIAALRARLGSTVKSFLRQ